VALCPGRAPSVAMATFRGGVGWLGRSLRGGVELGGLAGRRPSIGGQWQRRWSKQKGGRRVLAGWPRASLLPSMPSE
jgi:hypothetical protein